MFSVPDWDLIKEPYSNEPELEDSLHLTQIVLLLTCLQWWWRERQDFFAAANLSIYYQPPELQSKKFRGPDFFVVLDTTQRPRRSWVVANEGKYPNVVEILSKKTARADRTIKKELYQDLFKTPEYFWFYPRSANLEFQGFRLQQGEYQPIVPNPQGWLWSEELGLYLGVVEGNLRYFTADGVMIPNFEEATAQDQAIIQAVQQRAALEQQRATLEQQRADQAEAIAQQQQAEIARLQQLLRSQGIDPTPE